VISFQVREQPQVLAHFRRFDFTEKWPAVDSASFPRQLHSENLEGEENRCDCHYCEVTIEFWSVVSFQKHWFWMELPGKQGSPEPLHWAYRGRSEASRRRKTRSQRLSSRPLLENMTIPRALIDCMRKVFRQETTPNRTEGSRSFLGEWP